MTRAVMTSTMRNVYTPRATGGSSGRTSVSELLLFAEGVA
jgi:hypothetical protein